MAARMLKFQRLAAVLLGCALAGPAFAGGNNAATFFFQPGASTLQSPGNVNDYNAILERVIQYVNGSSLGQSSSIAAFSTGASNTTLAPISGLSITLQPGHQYTCDGYLTGTAPTTGGIKVSIVASNGLTASVVNLNGDNWNGTTPNAHLSATSLPAAVSTSPAVFTHLILSGSITTTLGGTLTVQAAQQTANATASTVAIGSTFGCQLVN